MEKENQDLVKLYKSLERNLKKHEKALESLPSGTIFVRKINNRSYVYRNKKVDGKVLSKYLGCSDDPLVKQEIKNSKLYKNNVLQIRELKKRLEVVSKEISQKNKQKPGKLLKFAISINQVDGLKPDKESIEVMSLYERGILTLEEAQKALMRITNAF